MNHSRLLHVYDFTSTPYDGDARQAHQLIPFIQSKLGAAKLSYILNEKDFPDPKPDALLMLMEAEHSRRMEAVAQAYQSKRQHYDVVLFPLYTRQLQRIQATTTISRAERDKALAELQIPVQPVLPDLPATAFNPGMESQLSKSRDQARRFEQGADEALQLIRSFLSIRCLTNCP